MQKKKGKPLQVKEMGYEDFIDTKILFNKMAPNMSKDFCGDDFKLSAVKMLRFQKGSNFFFFKYSYKQTEWSQVEFKPKKRRSSNGIDDVSSILLKAAYSTKIALPANKLKDLDSLCSSNIIPHFYRAFYESLK